MNFNAPLLKPIRILLFPFSLVYALVVRVRNFFYDKGILASASFSIPLIGVGNLAAGGTGKSTMVEFLIRSLKEHFRLAVLSRGYKRRTRGYSLAHSGVTALEIGDEPMLFHTKFPDVSIAVGEERLLAIPQLLHDKPDTEVILLDDAFQHRSIRAGLNIILTEYSNLYVHDWYLPTGDLRDNPYRINEAHIVVVTKCPADMTHAAGQKIEKELKLQSSQTLLFSSIRYGIPYQLTTRVEKALDMATEVLLVTGIANPQPLKQYLHAHTGTYYEMLFADHHIFTIDDWKEVVRRYDSIVSERKMLLTTEKDAVRLLKFGKELEKHPIYALPIRMDWLFGGEEVFLQLIRTYIQNNRKASTAA